jgi:hypothetical protein
MGCIWNILELFNTPKFADLLSLTNFEVILKRIPAKVLLRLCTEPEQVNQVTSRVPDDCEYE